MNFFKAGRNIAPATQVPNQDTQNNNGRAPAAMAAAAAAGEEDSSSVSHFLQTRPHNGAGSSQSHAASSSNLGAPAPQHRAEANNAASMVRFFRTKESIPTAQEEANGVLQAHSKTYLKAKMTEQTMRHHESARQEIEAAHATLQNALNAQLRSDHTSYETAEKARSAFITLIERKTTEINGINSDVKKISSEEAAALLGYSNTLLDQIKRREHEQQAKALIQEAQTAIETKNEGKLKDHLKVIKTLPEDLQEAALSQIWHQNQIQLTAVEELHEKINDEMKKLCEVKATYEMKLKKEEKELRELNQDTSDLGPFKREQQNRLVETNKQINISVQAKIDELEQQNRKPIQENNNDRRIHTKMKLMIDESQKAIAKKE